MYDEHEQREVPLYEDIKAVDKLSSALVPVEGTVIEPSDVSAVEQGTRYHPTGVVEDYRRIELRRR